MSTHNLNKTANDCGCCEGQAHSTPQRIYNRIGLPTIGYRVGDYHSFKQSMLARLSSSDLPELHGLTTRDENDFSIALIDAWAVTSEVLCFYQEYFANEGLLRTAKERLSILEHARLIGYQLHPGVAASSYIAFTMDEAPAGTDNPLLTTTVAAKAKIQSTPGPDESAQIYETENTITARVDWNALRPKLTQPQVIQSSMKSVVTNGISSFVKTGDKILLIDSSDNRHIKTVSNVIVDVDLNTTQLVIIDESVSPAAYSVEPKSVTGEYSLFDSYSQLNDSVIDLLVNKSWGLEDIVAIAETKHWDLQEVMQRINSHSSLTENISAGVGVYAFHKRANLFGYNAMKKVTYSGDVPNDISSWAEWNANEDKKILYLDTPQTEVVADSYVLVNVPSVKKIETYTDEGDYDISYAMRSGGYAGKTEGDLWFAEAKPKYEVVGHAIRITYTSKDSIAAQVKSVEELSRTEYGISSKTSRLELLDKDIFIDQTTGDMQLIRGASLHVKSEELSLVQVPLSETVSGTTILLQQADLFLRNQQYVALSGESADQEGVFYSEVLQIKEARLEHGFTQLIFTTNLKHSYKRDSVFINANVATVSHGESVSEVLGNGDAGLMSQKFILKQTPLTYVSAETSSGIASTLDIRVNNVLWHEVETFLDTQSDENIFTTKLNDDGSTIIYFGDGINGARLPSGNNNVIANYRKGIGLDGLLKSAQLNLLLTRPLGIKDASNPIASSGADDAEVLDDARSNAPLGLLTLGRAVSLQDYEDYCRSFACVRKAQAIAISHHGVSRIYITLAGPNGALIESGSKTHNDLLSSLKGSGDPFVQFSLLTYRPAFFKLDAELYIHPDYIHDLVIEDAQNALREAFSFDVRTFNQAVYLSEVIETLQHVEGVIAVDINHLYRSDATPMSPVPVVLKTTNTSSSIGGELLLLDPAPLDRIRVKS